MILTDTLSGSEPPTAGVGVEDSVYLQVYPDGRISSWSKKNGIWGIVSIVGAGAFGGIRIIDLGMVSLRDAAIYGRTRPLIPYANGRLIKAVHYVPGGNLVGFDTTLILLTPNTAAVWLNNASSGFGAVTLIGNPQTDTLGLITAKENTSLAGLKATTSSYRNQILDSGPLVACVTSTGLDFERITAWQPNTPYCLQDSVLFNDNYVQEITTNGVSGSTQPAFSTSGGSVNDGSAVWRNDFTLDPTWTVHVIAEVIEGVSPMPPYPATIEYVAPPSDIVATEPMADVTVIVKDQFRNPYGFGLAKVNLSILGDGTLTPDPQPSVDIDPTTGIATFTGLSITEPGTGYILRAIMYPTCVAIPILSDPFDVTAP